MPGVKRKADDKDSEPAPKKKQKLSETKKLDKKAAPQPSKLREQSTAGDDDDDVSIKGEGDTIQVAPRSVPEESAGKLKLSSSGVARKKPPKSGKKS